VVHDQISGEDTVYIYTDASRLVRPLLVVDEDGRLAIDRLSSEALAAGGRSLYGLPFEELIARGVVEYIDPWEQEFARVASTRNDVYSRLLDIQELEVNYQGLRQEHDYLSDPAGPGFDPERADAMRGEVEEAARALLAARKARRYTHCEIDPLAILSVAASINPYPNHSQAPRNMYQANMATQAVGLIHRNLGDRFESDKVRTLAYPNEPLVRTLLDENYGLRSHPQGNMVTVAFSCYTGATQEDAFLIKKSALERGLFRYVKSMVVTAKIQRDSQRLGRPSVPPGSPRAAAYRFMEANGLPMIGAYLKTDDAVVGILQNSLDGKLDDVSLTLKLGEDGIVDDVLVTGDETSTTVKVRLRVMRVPEAGDKLASRYAQKGTIGKIIPDEDMPFDPETGMRPDIVVNPHAIPSRMTCGLVLELVAGKYASLRGDRIDASAFRHYDFDEFKRLLKAYNFNEEGYHLLTSPLTGQPQRFQTFMGPCYFQLLKHIAKDKIQRRGRGTLRPDTRQPPRGRNLGGGLRFGEMERDAAMAFGAAAFTQERLCKLSDAYKVVMCRVCGEFAQSDPAGEKFICRVCGTKDQFGVTEIPYAFKYVKQLIATLGINVGFKLALPNEKSRQLMQGEDYNAEGREYEEGALEEEEEEEDYEYDDVAEVSFEE
ncbi:MAG: hypothetical protein KC910_30290, partial [Candidatus Eremiobacteraeota bacterium]|nr:hypothetical protein [Candidatus Eremiobacteraeota bacterium]